MPYRESRRNVAAPGKIDRIRSPWSGFREQGAIMLAALRIIVNQWDVQHRTSALRVVVAGDKRATELQAPICRQFAVGANCIIFSQRHILRSRLADELFEFGSRQWVAEVKTLILIAAGGI